VRLLDTSSGSRSSLSSGLGGELLSGSLSSCRLSGGLLVETEEGRESQQERNAKDGLSRRGKEWKAYLSSSHYWWFRLEVEVEGWRVE
jgi:hypothetical protein